MHIFSHFSSPGVSLLNFGEPRYINNIKSKILFGSRIIFFLDSVKISLLDVKNE